MKKTLTLASSSSACKSLAPLVSLRIFTATLTNRRPCCCAESGLLLLFRSLAAGGSRISTVPLTLTADEGEEDALVEFVALLLLDAADWLSKAFVVAGELIPSDESSGIRQTPW